MSWAEFANNVLNTFKPQLSVLFSLFVLYALIKITDQSVMSTFNDIWKEIVGAIQGKKGPRTLNAFGGLLTFGTMLFLNFGGLAHLSSDQHSSDIKYGISAFMVLVIGAYFILCLRATRGAD